MDWRAWNWLPEGTLIAMKDLSGAERATALRRGRHQNGGAFAKQGRECFNRNIETGVLHEVGLR
jgi:hypothetical protein